MDSAILATYEGSVETMRDALLSQLNFTITTVLPIVTAVIVIGFGLRWFVGFLRGH